MGYTNWCAACGNPDIIVEDTKSGYSMGKGIVGVAVLGPVGAVAGLDGKKTTSYYCPKCGARLDHCMPDYQVNNILMMLKNPEMNRSAIEREHERFPNMIMPKDWASENATGNANVPETVATEKILGKPDYSELKRILQTSKGSDAVDRIHAFFLKNGYISENDVSDFRVSLGCFPTQSPEYTLLYNAMIELEESYKLRVIFYHGEQVYEAARDRVEAKAWRYEAFADKTPVDDYLELVKELISIKPRTVKEVEQEIINKCPGINDDNPYTALSLAKRACLKLSEQDGLVSYDGEEIRKRSTKLTEEDLRWDTEESWRKSEVTRDGVVVIREMAPVMKSRDAVSLDELGRVVRATTQQKMAARLKQLVDGGYCTKQKSGGTVYYSLTPEAKAWNSKEFENFIKAAQRTMFVGEDTKVLVARKLKDKSGLSFFDIMGDEIKDSREMQKFYECFMILELEGNARRIEKPKEYIWEFIDKEAEARKKHEEERKQELKKLNEVRQKKEAELADICKQIERIKAGDYELGEEEKKEQERLKESLKVARETAEQVEADFASMPEKAEVKRLEGEIADKQRQLAGLGLFKGKEKKNLQQQISILEQSLYRARSKVEIRSKAVSQQQHNYHIIESKVDNFKEQALKKEYLRLIRQKANIIFGDPKVGDKVYFGLYEQWDEVQPIEWRVLETGSKLLLITEYGIDCKPYNETREDITWEKCSLRRWLNHDFLKKAFNEDEELMILASTVKADANPKFNIDAGIDTSDKVFLLSFSEAQRYLSSNIQRICKPTAYAKKQGTNINTDAEVCWWWLRSTGNISSNAAFISNDGSVNFYGSYVDNNNICLRPALWIDLKLDSLSF